MQKLFLCFLMLAGLNIQGQRYQPNWESLNKREIPKWFQQDKFGIFIHWGVYAVPSFARLNQKGDEGFSEWYWNLLSANKKELVDFHNKNYGVNFEYPQFENLFKAELFDPTQWADIIKGSGARYVVLTSKHHDGYCLWNSMEADKSWGRPWNAVTGTPKRDLLGDLSVAIRAVGLKMGYYYSLYEWYNPLWRTDKQQYVREHMIPQFKDLVTRYKPSVIFSDGDWLLKDTAWQSEEVLAWLFNDSPVAKEIVVNDRWGANANKRHRSTYWSSEYGTGLDAAAIWEESQGSGHSYGYNRTENLKDYKTSRHLILILADVVSRGGNLLLDIGPTADGRIPVIMQQRLLDMGNWLKINGEAIYGSGALDQPRQWSEGVVPQTKINTLWADYNINTLTTPKKDTAHIEVFFTRKEKDLYCIVPDYKPQLLIKNLNVPENTTANFLANNHTVKVKNVGKNCMIDLSGLKPNELPAELFVIKLINVL